MNGSPEQQQLRREARSFAEDVLVQVGPAIRDISDPLARFQATRPMYEAAISAGFLRRMIPVPLGGGGTGTMDMAILAEEFYARDASVSLTLFGNMLGLLPLLIAGTGEQQQHFIAPFLRTDGAPLAATANSEPGGSANFESDAPDGGTRTRAVRDGDSWVINGAKKWISSATGWDGRGADLQCVVCTTDPDAGPDGRLSVLLVPGPIDGVVLDSCIDAVGHRGHLLPSYRLENVRVPANHVVGEVGGGRVIVEGAFSATAALVGVMATGLLRSAYEFTRDFARREKRGGPVPIIEHQAVGYGLANAKSALEAIRSLSYRACAAIDAEAADAHELSLHAKIYCSEVAVRTITDLMSLVGIDSYDHDLPLASLLQDALVLPLFDGGNMGVRRRQLHGLLLSGQI